MMHTYLMVAKSKIPDSPIVLQHALLQVLYTRLILEVQITLQEPLVELNDLSKGEVLARRLVQTTSCLNELEEGKDA